MGAFAFLFVTYLVAAVPFGLVLTTLAGGEDDIREAGSGNIGATNVARVAGWSLAVPALLLDVAKGAVPVWLAAWGWPEWGVWWMGAAGLVAFLGHIYPVYLAFHGGKGVATGAGVVLGLAPVVALLAVCAWALLLAVFGRSSLASLGATLVMVLSAMWVAPAVVPVAAVLSVGVVHAHVPNIRRLVAGDEQAIIRPVRWGRSRDAVSADAILARDPAGRPIADVETGG